MDVKYDGLRFKTNKTLSGQFKAEGENTPLKVTTDDARLSVHKVIYRINKKYNSDYVIITQEEIDKLIKDGLIESVSPDEIEANVVSTSRLDEVE
jgi:hypothetical protein